MGIQGLLIGLKPFSTPGHIQDFRGKAIAIDTSSWLHKSVYSIADHYVECIEQNKLDGRCVNTSAKYITQRCEELLTGAGIQRIYLVMDGKRCPMKAGTNQERDARRQENLRQARSYRRQKRHDAMCEKYRSCIKVTEELATKVVRLVQKRLTASVEIVWSPYEADAQLAQLCVDGRAAAVVTEDSDVLVYSASSRKIFPIIFKLDRRSGECDILSLDWLLNADPKHEPRQTNQDVTILEVVLRVLRSREVSKPGWGSRLFVQGCVLAGCDYAPRKVAGVGLVNAFKMVRNAGCTGSPRNLSKVFRQILFSAISVKSRGALGDISEFENLLAQSEAVFYYHPVVLQDGTITHLNNIAQDDSLIPSIERFEDASFLGSLVANPNESCIIPTVATRVHKTKSPPKPSKQKQPAVSISKIINPYKRKPLVNRSPNKSNIFAAYAKRHKQPERQQRSFKIVTAQLPVKSKEPSRTLKRNFEYDVDEGEAQIEDLEKRIRKDREYLESPQKVPQKTDPGSLRQSTRHDWNPAAYNDHKTTNSPPKITSKPHLQRPQLSMPPSSLLVREGDKKSKGSGPGPSRHVVPPVVSIKNHDAPHMNMGSQLTMDDDFNETSAYFNKAEDDCNSLDPQRPSEDSTTAAFCYSPNLLEDSIPSPQKEPPKFANSVDLVDQQDVHRRVTLGVTPFSTRRTTLRAEGFAQPPESESPVIDLSGDDEQGTAFPSSFAKVNAPSPGVLRYCVGGGLASAKTLPKRRNRRVAKYLRDRRAKAGLQTKMSEWFQKRGGAK